MHNYGIVKFVLLIIILKKTRPLTFQSLSVEAFVYD